MFFATIYKASRGQSREGDRSSYRLAVSSTLLIAASPRGSGSHVVRLRISSQTSPSPSAQTPPNPPGTPPASTPGSHIAQTANPNAPSQLVGKTRAPPQNSRTPPHSAPHAAQRMAPPAAGTPPASSGTSATSARKCSPITFRGSSRSRRALKAFIASADRNQDTRRGQQHQKWGENIVSKKTLLSRPPT